jgi:glycerophosphoryl diester phosphodiesterase
MSLRPIRETALIKDYFVAAHRGSSGTAPENTLAAYREAVAAGADIVEADVQLTADGHVVAFHDKHLSRTSDSAGKIDELDYEHLKDADAGSWFGPDFKNERIPLLHDVIDVIRDKTYLNIEVKNIVGGNLDDNIKRIIDIIYEEEYQDYTVLSSFYYDTLHLIKKHFPVFPLLAIRIPRDTRLPSQILNETGCDAFICAKDELNKEVAEDIIKNNIYTAVYSIDTKQDFDEVIKLPVKALVTNFPARIKQFLDEYRGERQ